MMLVAIRAGLLNQLQSIGGQSPRRFSRLCESVPLKCDGRGGGDRILVHIL
jgi:hypothetical protein